MRPVLPRLLLSILPLIAPGALSAQLPIPLVLEARVGWAIPAGEFGDGSTGLVVGSGPSFAAGARLDVLSEVGIFAAYNQARFACEQCPALELEDDAVLDGVEGGVRLALPIRAGRYEPWLRAAVLYQRLAFSGFGETLASDDAIGFSGAVGLAIPVGPLRLVPRATFFSVPTNFDFETLTDRSVDVTAFTFDLGVTYSF